MAYPTVSFQPTTPFAGLQPIAQASTTQMHTLGTIVRAQDISYGEGEFIYLLGVASTAAGDLVCYNSKTGVTVRAVSGGGTSVGAAGIAMAATVAGTYGWYQISGSGPINCATVAANAQAFLTSTAGQVDDSGSGAVSGLLFKSADSAGFATVQIDRPSVNPAESGSNTGDVTLTAVGSTPSANGASLSGQALTLQPADATHPGVVTTAAQTFAGAKTFGVVNTDNLLPISDEGQVFGATNKRWAWGYLEALRDNGNNVRFGNAGSAGNTYKGAVPNGGTAVAHSFDNSDALSTASALLARFGSNAVFKSSISKDGAYGGTYTDISGTPGTGTVSTVTGRFKIANGTGSGGISFTCSLCLTTSIVKAQLETSAAGVCGAKVVPGNGSFVVTTVNGTGVATDTGADCQFSFILFNGA